MTTSDLTPTILPVRSAGCAPPSSAGHAAANGLGGPGGTPFPPRRSCPWGARYGRGTGPGYGHRHLVSTLRHAAYAGETASAQAAPAPRCQYQHKTSRTRTVGGRHDTLSQHPIPRPRDRSRPFGCPQHPKSLAPVVARLEPDQPEMRDAGAPDDDRPRGGRPHLRGRLVPPLRMTANLGPVLLAHVGSISTGPLPAQCRSSPVFLQPEIQYSSPVSTSWSLRTARCP